MTDRAIWVLYLDEGKRFFEEVARSGLEKNVSPNLLKELLARRVLDGYEKSPVERFTHDLSVFHRVMSVVIETSTLPFYERQPLLRQWKDELEKQRGTAAEPMFTLLLLRDVPETMRLLTQEQSGNELAYLALSAALSNDYHRRKVLNFLTGNHYEFRLIPDGIMCTYEGNIKPFYVPYR
jgi:hypothetical protein